MKSFCIALPLLENKQGTLSSKRRFWIALPGNNRTFCNIANVCYAASAIGRGRSLLDPAGTPEETARQLFEAPFVVVSHGTQPDPILNYGNRKALELWQMDWERFTQTPSRCTAEPIAREERARLLEQASVKGYIDDYQSIRISSTGQRFWIQNVVIWEVLDEQNSCCGQAATFDRWEFIV